MVTTFLLACTIALAALAWAAPQLARLNQMLLERSPRAVRRFYQSRLLSFGHPDRSDPFWVAYLRIVSLLLAAAFAAALIWQLVRGR